MTLDADLERIAAAASAHGPVSAVLAAEPAGAGGSISCALGEDEPPDWLVLDADGEPVTDRALVREVALDRGCCPSWPRISRAAGNSTSCGPSSRSSA